MAATIKNFGVSKLFRLFCIAVFTILSLVAVSVSDRAEAMDLCHFDSSQKCFSIVTKGKPILAADNNSSPEKKFYPIALKCPALNMGTLEYVAGTRRGNLARVKADYFDEQNKKSNRAIAVSFSTREKNSSEFVTSLKVLLDDTNHEFYEDAKKYAAASDKLKLEICQGDLKQRNEYLSKISKNIAALGFSPLEFPSKVRK